MIRIRRPDGATVLGARTLAYLARKSSEAAAYPSRDPRIRTSWASFLDTVARSDVESALDAHTRGKCAYCEAIAAKDIEHFYPKSLYPARMFSWDNLLRGCKNCNNAKVDRFPLDGAGQRLLLDPCSDEPLEYFVWDPLTGATGLSPEVSRQPRAATTRELFALDQEAIREERRVKSLTFQFLLSRAVREDPVSRETLERLRDELLPHRPWLGILRQILTRPGPDLKPLVDAATAKLPEIRTWAADWL